MSEDAFAELTSDDVLRAGINMANPLLVTGKTADVDPAGVAPDMARAIAEALGAEVAYVQYAAPGEVADAADQNLWDIGLIAAEPARAESIAFTAAYVEIEATYLVPGGSPLQSIDDVDRDGVRIAVSERSAYDLYLSRSLTHAQLARVKGVDAAFQLFTGENCDALAGLRPALLPLAEKLQGSRLLDGYFTTVQQAVGTPRANQAGAAFLRQFVELAKASGLVRSLIERHGVTGRLSVAPAA